MYRFSTAAFINPFTPSRLFYFNSFEQPVSKRRSVYSLFLLTCCFKETLAFNANSADPDETPRSAASDLALRGLPTSLLWDARHKRVNVCMHFRSLLLLVCIYVCSLCRIKHYYILSALQYHQMTNLSKFFSFFLFFFLFYFFQTEI